MRVKSPKDTIIVLNSSSSSSFKFQSTLSVSSKTPYKSLKPDPAEFVWMPHPDLFLLPALSDAIWVSATPHSQFSLVKPFLSNSNRQVQKMDLYTYLIQTVPICTDDKSLSPFETQLAVI